MRKDILEPDTRTLRTNMAGLGGSLANRPLSTTEELEKLEQSITLTLQGMQGADMGQLGQGDWRTLESS